MITIEDLKKSRTRGVFFLDGDDHYHNQFECVEYPRLTVVNSGPRGVLPRRRKPGTPTKHTRRYFVDGIECADLDAVVAALNAEPA